MPPENKRIEELERQVSEMKRVVEMMFLRDRFYFPLDVELEDGYAMRFGSKTGGKIGTSTSQKLAFFGATPVSRQSGFASLSETGADQDATARASINVLRTALINLGLISSS